MKVLVTGGAGFVGSHIVDLLMERSHTVVVYDNMSSGRLENLINHFGDRPRIGFIQGDVLSSDLITTAEIGIPDAICHQAAQPSLLTSVKDPRLDADINILGTINVIEAANRCGAHLVMASTSAVYDEHAPLPYSEDARKHPTRPYGIAKYAAEMYVRELAKSYTVLRYGNVYGPRQVTVGENQLVPHALDRIYKGKPFVVNGDGEQTRDFVYVGDVARANVLAMESKVRGTFNIAPSTPHSVNEVLTMLKDFTGYTGQWQHGPSKDKEPRSVFLDNTKAMQSGLWEEGVTLFSGLRSTVEWYKRESK